MNDNKDDDEVEGGGGDGGNSNINFVSIQHFSNVTWFLFFKAGKFRNEKIKK